MKIRLIAAGVAATAALVLTGCSSSITSHTGIVTDVAQQGASTYYTIETREATGIRVYECDSYRELSCALLKKGDSISFVTYGSAHMHKIARTAAANA